MVASFVVPGSVTLRDVSRAPKDETTPQRFYRLAQKAVIEGCRTLRVYGSGHFLVTSASDPGTAYQVDRECKTCNCQGFARHGACKHIALVLAELGELPDPNPEPPAPAIALPVPVEEHDEAATTRVQIVCEACTGTGQDAYLNTMGEWIDMTCCVCDGRGQGDIDVLTSELHELDAISAGVLLGAQCSVCHGAGYNRMPSGGHLADWTPITCRNCQGAGIVPTHRAEVIAA